MCITTPLKNNPRTISYKETIKKKVTQDIEEDIQQFKTHKNKDITYDNGKNSNNPTENTYNRKNESSLSDNGNSSEEKPRHKHGKR